MRLTGGKLPKGFVLAKPIAQEGYDESVIYELERQERLVITRKRDGWKMLALVGAKGSVRLYTDGINEIDSRLDHIREEIQKIGFSANTLIVGEAIVDLNNKDDLGRVVSIFHSNLDKSLLIQRKYGKVRFMVFAVISFGETEAGSSTLNHGYRHEIGKSSYKYIFNVPLILETFDRAKE